MLSAIALYSSGPVTPSMRKRPCASWCPSERQKPRGLHEQLEPGLPLECLVIRCILVPHDGVGDVRADVERRRAGGPVTRALLAPDRAPGERRALQTELARSLACKLESGVAPAERVASRARHRVGQHGQHEALGVPEGVAVVARPGETLSSDGALLGTCAGLERVEEREADRLL